jgi:hypothetical protein
VRSSPKENQSLEVKVKGISEMEFSLSIFDYTFTNYILPTHSTMAVAAAKIFDEDDFALRNLISRFLGQKN